MDPHHRLKSTLNHTTESKLLSYSPDGFVKNTSSQIREGLLPKVLQYHRSHNGVWIEFEAEQAVRLPDMAQRQGGGGAGPAGVDVPPSLTALAPSLAPGRPPRSPQVG